MIWLSFVCSAGCGLMVIKCLKNFGTLEGGLTAAQAGSALGLLALFNGLGRVVWGSLSQKLTAKWSVVVMCVLQGAMMFVLLKMGSAVMTLTIAACWLGFNFGGNFALFPLLTLENFGPKNLGWLDESGAGDLFTVHQLPYNLLWRTIEYEILRETVKRNMGIIAYSTLAQGLLTGAYTDVDSVPDYMKCTRFNDAGHVGADHGENKQSFHLVS